MRSSYAVPALIVEPYTANTRKSLQAHSDGWSRVAVLRLRGSLLDELMMSPA
jgi:hypothetical protein